MSKFLVIVTDKSTLHETTYYDVKDIVEHILSYHYYLNDKEFEDALKGKEEN